MYAHLPKYRAPGYNADEPSPDYRKWSEARDHYEKKRYRDAVIATLSHCNSELLRGCDLGLCTIAVEATHGSAKVSLSIDGDTFSVHAPFLRLGTEHRVPLMRRVAEVNFQPLTLPTIRLEEDVLSFEYDAPLELCEPRKILDVLFDVCIFADRYDDEFANKYGASFYREPDVTELNPTEKRELRDHLNEIVSEYRRYSAFFEEKHADRLQWDITTTSMLQIASIPAIHGSLRWDLSDQIGHMYNPEIEPAIRLGTGKKFLDDLCARIDRQEVDPDIYHASSFLSLKQNGSTPQLQQACQQARDPLYETINSGNAYAAAFFLLHFFCRLVYFHNLSPDHRQIICDSLEQASGASPSEATPSLQKLFDGFLQGSPVAGKATGKRGGFFSRLFK